MSNYLLRSAVLANELNLIRHIGLRSHKEKKCQIFSEEKYLPESCLLSADLNLRIPHMPECPFSNGTTHLILKMY